MVAWKQIRVGRYQSAKFYKKKLADVNCLVTRRADHLLTQISYQVRLTPYAGVKVTGRELGLEGPVTQLQVLCRAEARGLRMFPQETAFALRLQYIDQPAHTELRVGSMPISSGRAFWLLYLAHAQPSIELAKDPKPALLVCGAALSATVNADSEWVFAL